MDILKRSLAPITDVAWEEIDESSRKAFSNFLSARKVVDVEGPHGWDFPGIPVGRLDVPEKQNSKGVEYGLTRVQSLVEARSYFELSIWELDNLSRGALDVDLDPLEEAAKNIARFEEKAVYYGFDDGNIKGMLETSEHEPLVHNGEPGALLETVSLGITRLVESGIEGPYALVVGPEFWRSLSNCGLGYPLRNQLQNLLSGSLVLSPFVDGAFMVSMQGGDMRLVLGQDLSIGYLGHDKDKVKLFFTESFTFQILEPAAIMPLQWKK